MSTSEGDNILRSTQSTSTLKSVLFYFKITNCTKASKIEMNLEKSKCIKISPIFNIKFN